MASKSTKKRRLVTIETEKAAMDVPAPAAGRIAQVKLKTGDKVSEGSLILLLEPAAAEAAPARAESTPPGAAAEPPSGGAAPRRLPQMPAPAEEAASPGAAATPAAAPRRRHRAARRAKLRLVAIDEAAFSTAHASPSVRKFARELGADLGKVQGTGVKGRITQDDVKAHVKGLLRSGRRRRAGSGAAASGGRGFRAFWSCRGQTAVAHPEDLRRTIAGKLAESAARDSARRCRYHRSGSGARRTKNKAAQEEVRLTPLVFIIKACILALREFPRFNASLDESGENLVLKKYFNIGFAADTPNGLVVPVIANADQLSIYDTARALTALSEKARAGKLKAAEMQGGSFTISSLGGIGGTYFTPIINAPEVAILGVSKSSQKPVYERGALCTAADAAAVPVL